MHIFRKQGWKFHIFRDINCVYKHLGPSPWHFLLLRVFLPILIVCTTLGWPVSTYPPLTSVFGVCSFVSVANSSLSICQDFQLFLQCLFSSVFFFVCLFVLELSCFMHCFLPASLDLFAHAGQLSTVPAFLFCNPLYPLLNHWTAPVLPQYSAFGSYSMFHGYFAHTVKHKHVPSAGLWAETGRYKEVGERRKLSKSNE